MTKQELRDHFAGLALQGMIAGRINPVQETPMIEWVKDSIKIADAMLTERENHEHEWGNVLCSEANGCNKTCTLCGKVELLEE